MCIQRRMVSHFFFNDTATTEIYTLSLHDALPISDFSYQPLFPPEELGDAGRVRWVSGAPGKPDRKSTRLNSSHQIISYAVFCLKKKKTLVERKGSQTQYPTSWPDASLHLRTTHAR